MPAADIRSPIPAENARDVPEDVDIANITVGVDIEAEKVEKETAGHDRASRVPRTLWTINLILGMFGVGVALGMLGPTLLEVSSQLNVSLADAGILFLFRGIGNLTGVLVAGWAMDHLPNYACVLALPISGACLGSWSIPHLQSVPVACAVFLIQGASMGALDTAGNVLLLTLWRGSKHLNGLMHALHFCFGFGAFIAPLLVGAAVKLGSEATAAWYITGATLLPSSAGFLALCFSAQPTSEVQEAGAATPTCVKPIVFTGLFLFLYVGMEVGFGGYIDAFAVQWVGVNKISAAMVNSVYWGALTAGRLVSAVVTPFVHHTRFLVGHLALAVLGAGILAAATMNRPNADDSALWWLGVVVPSAFVGFAFAPLFPGAMLAAEEILQAPLSGRAASVLVTSGAVGEMVLPLAIGVAFEVHETLFGWGILAMCTCASIVFLALGASILMKPMPHELPSSDTQVTT